MEPQAENYDGLLTFFLSTKQRYKFHIKFIINSDKVHNKNVKKISYEVHNKNML